MMLWAVFAVLTLAVIGILYSPFLKKAGETAPRVDYDMDVYRDQLSELEQEIRSEERRVGKECRL